jgi:hypothetical protein
MAEVSDAPSETPGPGLRQLLLCVPLALLGVVGGFALTNALTPRPAPPHVRKAEHIRERLQDVASELRLHKARTGSYPTNDQGLAALAFEVRYPVHCEAVVYHSARRIVSCGTATQQVSWPPSEWGNDCKPQGPPRSADELVKGGHKPFADGLQRHAVDLDVGISHAGILHLVSPAGIFSGSTLPLGYEDRRGLPEAAFADSPATRDRSRRYSVRVDDGVYLYSTEGELYAQVASEELHARVRMGLFGLALLLVALLLVRVAFRKGKRSGGVIVTASAAGFGLLVNAAPTCLMTCYIMADMLAGDPRPVARQRELLERYHARGVITDATYRKMVASLDLPPASQPSSQTASSPSGSGT